MPFAPYEGGSLTAASVGVAVQAACIGLKKKLHKLARSVADAPFARTAFNEVRFKDGNIYLAADEDVSLPIAGIIAHNKGKTVKSKNTGTPRLVKLRNYSKAVHSASFVEVEVDPEFGTVTVTRALTAVAAGKIINPKTARSQILGSMVWGISKALREETVLDHRYGRYVNMDLAEYHIPVHADIHDLDVMFVEEKDEKINELGVKGVGEIALVSMIPAVVNAVFHATGIRAKKLPILLDALLDIPANGI
jgi:xanthine dehydrogenase YagR molybdenum-binding subunit